MLRAGARSRKKSGEREPRETMRSRKYREESGKCGAAAENRGEISRGWDRVCGKANLIPKIYLT